MGHVECPGLKQILQIVEGPDSAVGMTSAKIKASLAAIEAKEAEERAAERPRTRREGAPASPFKVNGPPSITLLAGAPTQPANTTSVGLPAVPPRGLGIVNDTVGGSDAVQTANQPVSTFAVPPPPIGSGIVARTQTDGQTGSAGAIDPASTTARVRREMGNLSHDNT